MSNSIHRCPNCNYMLVLLERRGKFKCSRCGKLFLPKFIENKTFKQWNEKQRETDLHNIKLESKRPKLTEEEKKIRAKECSSRYYEKNKEKSKLYIKNWRAKNKEHRNEAVRIHRQKHLDQVRLCDRLGRWRQRQKELAQQELKINGYKPYTNGLDGSFSTFGLSHLLRVPIAF